MKTKKSALEKLNDDGLWNGPTAFLNTKLKFAYQLANNPAFIGVFEKNSFKEYPEHDSGHNTLYLGKPSDLFQPVVGRDKIRDENGELKILDTEIPTKTQPKIINPQASQDTLKAYPLDWTRQKPIFSPWSFDGFDVQLSGLGPLGLEIAINLYKLGLTKLKIYDPLNVAPQDLAVAGYRTFDVNRARGTVAYELIADMSLKEADINLKYLTSDIGNIVINTLDAHDIRQTIWNNIKNKPGFFLDVQTSGNSGTIYAINPADKDSIELYEESLGDSPNEDTTIDIIRTVAGIATAAFRRYIATPGAERANCLDRMYKIDFDSFFRHQGVWGKTSAK